MTSRVRGVACWPKLKLVDFIIFAVRGLWGFASAQNGVSGGLFTQLAQIITMRKLIVVLWLGVCFQGGATASNRLDSLLRVLDQVVAERQVFDTARANRLGELKLKLANASSDLERFALLGDLFEGYLPYNTDSALVFTRQRYNLAQKMGNPQFLATSCMNLASIYGNTGMFYEARQWLVEAGKLPLNADLQCYRFHLFRTLYGAMELFASNASDQKKYARLTDQYRDSIKAVIPSFGKDYLFVESDQLIVRGNYAQALHMLASYYRTLSGDSHDRAIVAYSISEAYRGLQQPQKEMEYLAESAISDLRSAIKEYISLWQLAILLFDHQQIDRSYNYLKCSLEDATFSKSRLRTVKITEVFPIIEKAYQYQRDMQKRRMRVLIWAISILGFGLSIALAAVGIQLRRLSAVRRALSKANHQLSDLNHNLQYSNGALQQTNQTLAETSQIKEEYIGRYMDLCSAYIDKMDDYRRTLNKKASGGKLDELVDELKSNVWIKEELKTFYTHFDRSFLHLFPSFVSDFNALLQPGEAIQLKNDELLNTELRIFALIRLGITDSEQIAQFLRYSISTIYNYRTKMRNKAAGERSEFEQKVTGLGR